MNNLYVFIGLILGFYSGMNCLNIVTNLETREFNISINIKYRNILISIIFPHSIIIQICLASVIYVSIFCISPMLERVFKKIVCINYK